MKITNNYNLPDALVKYCEESQFGVKNKYYSVTTILNPVRSVLLMRRHNDEIVKDASEMINTLFGSATHSLIEKFDKTGFAEMYLSQEITDGYYLTGKCDLYDEKNYALVDYKTATCWKIIFKDFDDWKKQGLMYAWLLSKQHRLVSKLKFHALLKDWTAKDLRLAKLKGDFYPETQVYTWEYDVTTQDLIEIENFINERFSALIDGETLSDFDLPDCGKVDTWYTGDKFAVYKNVNDARATRVFDNEKEAKDFITNKGGVLVYRKGEYRKCQDYCDCHEFCRYWEERKIC